jgi:hypothetical protein
MVLGVFGGGAFVVADRTFEGAVQARGPVEQVSDAQAPFAVVVAAQLGGEQDRAAAFSGLGPVSAK